MKHLLLTAQITSGCGGEGNASLQWRSRRGPGLWFRVGLALAFAISLPSTSIAGVQGGASSCITDAYVAQGNTGGLNCTGGDVSIASAETFQVIDGCSSPGDTAEVQIKLNYVINAATRYDIGSFIATDGGDALNGTCFREYLSPPLSETPTPADLLTGFGPYLDAEVGAQGVSDDACGDAQSGADPTRIVSTEADPSQYQTLTLPCRDSNGDGFLDFQTCTGWWQNESYACTGLTGGFVAGVPGNGSKCECSTVTLAGIAVPALSLAPASMTLTKTVMLAGGTCGVNDVPGPLETAVGASVVYCYSVTAAGTPATNRYVANVSLVDDMGTPGDPADDQTITLSPLSDLDGGGTDNDLQAGATATGQSTAVTVP
jgi:hypothetical protein